MKLRYISLFILMLYSYQGVAMTLIFGGEKVEAVLFSPLEGHITFEGKPTTGAKLILWLKWKDTKGEFHEYRADDKGYFTIPKHTGIYRESPLAQLVITQEITVEYQAKNYLIWTLSKTIGHEFGELGKQPKNLKCELTDEMEPVRTDSVLMGTLCKWDQMP